MFTRKKHCNKKLHMTFIIKSNDDRRKAALMKSPRFDTLKRLAGIDLMPKQQLDEAQKHLSGLESCFDLIERDLQMSPLCPHCGFRPADVKPGSAAAALRLDQLHVEVELMLERWTNAILENLAPEHLALLKTDDRARVEAFIASRTLPLPVDHDLVHALREALSGLQKVTISLDELHKVLQNGGSPATPEEFAKRFHTYLDSLIHGTDPAKVRIVLE